jgi:quercetin dioxygenase-like cupin family protein
MSLFTRLSRLALFFVSTGYVVLGFNSAACAIENSSTVHVQPILKTTKSWDGALIRYPEGQAEISGVIIDIAPGGETGWHLHPAPSFGMVLEGSLDVSLKDGKTKHLEKGDSMVEVVNTLHNGRNNGTTPLKLVIFYAGVEGQKLSVKEKSSGK